MLVATGAGAVIPVVDEASLLQTTITAGKAVLTEAHETVIANQTLQSYLQDAKALVALPMSYIDQVSALYGQYNNALSQAQGAAWTLRNSVEQFEQLYSGVGAGNASVVQRAQAMLGQVRAAARAAAQATALFDRLCAQQTSVATLITASQAASGPLGAQQATNQLLGVLADQQGSLQQMQATLGRVQMGYIMRQAVAEEQAQTNAQQFLLLPEQIPWNQRPSKGFTLPE
jgi:P-type conjugative transfer protein TrbJ